MLDDEKYFGEIKKGVFFLIRSSLERTTMNLRGKEKEDVNGAFRE